MMKLSQVRTALAAALLALLPPEAKAGPAACTVSREQAVARLVHRLNLIGIHADLSDLEFTGKILDTGFRKEPGDGTYDLAEFTAERGDALLIRVSYMAEAISAFDGQPWSKLEIYWGDAKEPCGAPTDAELRANLSASKTKDELFPLIPPAHPGKNWRPQAQTTAEFAQSRPGRGSIIAVWRYDRETGAVSDIVLAQQGIGGEQ